MDFCAERYGWGPWDMARIHPDELDKYLKGAEIRQEKKNRQMETGRQPSQNQRNRERDALENFS